jgi:hypothetical protein
MSSCPVRWRASNLRAQGMKVPHEGPSEDGFRGRTVPNAGLASRDGSKSPSPFAALALRSRDGSRRHKWPVPAQTLASWRLGDPSPFIAATPVPPHWDHGACGVGCMPHRVGTMVHPWCPTLPTALVPWSHRGVPCSHRVGTVVPPRCPMLPTALVPWSHRGVPCSPPHWDQGPFMVPHAPHHVGTMVPLWCRMLPILRTVSTSSSRLRPAPLRPPRTGTSTSRRPPIPSCSS